VFPSSGERIEFSLLLLLQSLNKANFLVQCLRLRGYEDYSVGFVAFSHQCPTF
jgi:hypothetical protein